MHSLIQFLARFGNTLLFVVLEIVALVLLFRYNDFHQSIALSSASRINGKIYETREQVTGYFLLREKNTLLWQQNGELEKKVARLEAALRQSGREEAPLRDADEFGYIYARVLKNSVIQQTNSFTLNVGRADGVQPGMGVTGPQGIAGIVSACSEHYSVVVSLLNVNAHFSCKVKNTDVVGSLTWHGGDTRYGWLEELPGYQMWNVGDTVVTSGFSNSFPAGLPVGCIESFDKTSAENFYTARIRLFTRFESLADVRIMYRTHFQEQRELEEAAK
ncbi:MAG: rod shape-determining protein MreC [Bacteroidales bacterium]|nr:rod shape-determining protein MreC [Bacteroidales bacterium]